MVDFVTETPGCRDRETRFVKEDKRFLDMRVCVIINNGSAWPHLEGQVMVSGVAVHGLPWQMYTMSDDICIGAISYEHRCQNVNTYGVRRC